MNTEETLQDYDETKIVLLTNEIERLNKNNTSQAETKLITGDPNAPLLSIATQKYNEIQRLPKESCSSLLGDLKVEANAKKNEG